MKIKTVVVKNFRKLHDILIEFDEVVTIIVGRNNSGKTSLSEIFSRFFGKSKSKFNFNDFSFCCHNQFKDAYKLYCEAIDFKSKGEVKEEEYLLKINEAKEKIPNIILNIYLEYEEKDESNLGGFEELNINLDDSRRDINISCQFYIKSVDNFFKELDRSVKDVEIKDDNTLNKFILNFVECNYSSFYKIEYFTFDKIKKEVINPISLNSIDNALTLDLIGAQRDLDDQSSDNKGRIAKSMVEFLDFSKCHDVNVRELAVKLEVLAKRMEKDHYDEIYKPILDDFKLFGIKEEDSKIIIKAIFDAQGILKGSSRFLYSVSGRELPESHNGLGYSNLIYITLKISIYCHLFENKIPRSLSHILFIEEPEAHLHPQMQMVFIRKIRNFIEEKKWNVQLIITTHSSQILSDCDFSSIRYFDSSLMYVNVKDMRNFIDIQDNTSKGDNGINFLQKYMNLGNCNLFFADKVIMVEGLTEKIILPKLIKEDKVLSKQYISIMEVGGACAHIFKNLIEFINVKTLIITDIDSCTKTKKKNKNGIEQTTYPSCPVKEINAITCNSVLKTWIPKKNKIIDLLNCQKEEKIDGIFRVAYQIPERKNGTCGRSFEEAFFLSNIDILENYSGGLILGTLFNSLSKKEIRALSYEITQDSSFNSKKSCIALDILSINKWTIPKYIKESLEWLAKN